MSIRTISFADDEYYHIYNRGNSKQEIFRGEADYYRLLKLLYTANSDKNIIIRNFSKDVYNLKRGNRLVYIGAYCFMPNHFHLLVRQPKNGNITKFMHKLTTSYSMYFNNKHGRTGTLFEGKFKSQYANDDRYLKYLFSYIHLNPIKLIDPLWKEFRLKNRSKTLEFLDKYKFSSYLDYMNYDRSDKAVIDRENFPDYFTTKKSFKSEIFDWINLDA